MKLSIVIPTHRRHQSLQDLLSSITHQSLAKDQFEVLIVSNLADPFLSSEPLQSLLVGLEHQVLTVGQVGVNRARNLGLAQSRGEIVLFLDDDCELQSFDFLKRVLLAHEQFPKALAIGGVYKLPPDVSLPDMAYHVVARAWQEPVQVGDYHSWRLVGGNVSYKAQRLRHLGLRFAEDIVFGGAESEFHARLEKAGQVGVLLTSLEVVHRTHLSVQDLWKKAYAQAKTRQRFQFRDHCPGHRDRAYLTQQGKILRQVCQDAQRFDDALLAVESFDQVFKLAQTEKSERRVLTAARKWVRSRTRQLQEGSL